MVKPAGRIDPSGRDAWVAQNDPDHDDRKDGQDHEVEGLILPLLAAGTIGA